MASPQIGLRCPNCSETTSADAEFCPHCGTPLGSEPVPDRAEATDVRRLPQAEVVPAPPKRSTVNRRLRLLLLIWIVAYPVILLGASLLGARLGPDAASMAAVSSVVIGAAVLIPWLVGLLALGLLTLFTR